jgi:hypothetical protein
LSTPALGCTTSYPVGTGGSFSEVKRKGLKLTTHHQVVPRSRVHSSCMHLRGTVLSQLSKRKAIPVTDRGDHRPLRRHLTDGSEVASLTSRPHLPKSPGTLF